MVDTWPKSIFVFPLLSMYLSIYLPTITKGVKGPCRRLRLFSGQLDKTLFMCQHFFVFSEIDNRPLNLIPHAFFKCFTPKYIILCNEILKI